MKIFRYINDLIEGWLHHVPGQIPKPDYDYLFNEDGTIDLYRVKSYEDLFSLHTDIGNMLSGDIKSHVDLTQLHTDIEKILESCNEDDFEYFIDVANRIENADDMDLDNNMDHLRAKMTTQELTTVLD